MKPALDQGASRCGFQHPPQHGEVGSHRLIAVLDQSPGSGQFGIRNRLTANPVLDRSQHSAIHPYELPKFVGFDGLDHLVDFLLVGDLIFCGEGDSSRVTFKSLLAAVNG